MFKQRSKQKELLDGKVEREDLVQNLKELHEINKLLGGYNISLSALKTIDTQNKVLVDIGSGGGDTLEEIRKWSVSQKQTMTLIGIDLKADCVEYSKSHLNKSLTFIEDDYRNIGAHLSNVDIIHACLFTHHLTNDEITELIELAKNKNSVLIINDLNRNSIAYYGIKLLTRVFSKSHLVKHDAPLSVLRGFTKKEWKNLIQSAGATNYSIKWKWAFRHQIIIYG